MAASAALQLEQRRDWPKARQYFAVLFLIGAALRFPGVLRPIDLPNWRECDVASIARNFEREGMNILYPRIDWRGDGPGFVESEFPVYPWTIAALYRVFGEHEIIARIIPFLLSLVSMAVFFALARRLLPPAGALAADAVFMANPLVNLVGYSVQPEGLMYCATWIAVYAFVRWLDEDSPAFYWISIAATALAILGKITAAHIGIFFAVWLISERGVATALRSWRSWVFGILALTPALLWYAHAHNLWTTYGNSLGFSNEDHWARADLFTNPRLLGGVATVELWFVWTLPGAIIALYGVWTNPRARVVRFAAMYLLAVGIYYLVAARTLSALWANYYHLASVAPAALLMGHGIGAAGQARRRWLYAAAGAGLAAVVWIFVANKLMKSVPAYANRLVGPAWPTSLTVAIVAAAAITAYWITGNTRSRLICLLAAMTLFIQGAVTVGQLRNRTGQDRYFCARRFAPQIPSDALIIASGGFRIGPTGRHAASDAPYMFYWLDRKGFSLPNEDQTVATVEQLTSRGARVFVAEKDSVALKPGFEQELLSRYRLIDDCSTAWLFDLARE